MTLNDLKEQIRHYWQESKAVGNPTISDEFRPLLQQQAQLLGLSDADLQRLINIVGKETDAQEEEEDIFDWTAHLPATEENSSETVSNQGQEAEEQARRLAELRAKEEALARQKAEEEAVERHNRQILEQQQRQTNPITASPRLSLEESVSKPTFEGSPKRDKQAAKSPIQKVFPWIAAFLLLGAGGVAAFFWYKPEKVKGGASVVERATLPPIIGNDFSATEMAGVYNGTIRYRDEDDPVQIEIYNVKPAVNQRFTFQFRGMQERRRQKMQGPGEVELSKGSIFIAHRLMGEATIIQEDDGTIRIQGATYQLVKKP